MTGSRANEIVRLVFYRHIDNMKEMLSRSCDSSEVAYEIGRYVGMMQKDLETELKKEVKESDEE